MTLTAAVVNQPPTGTSHTITASENGAYTFTAADFGFTDPNSPPDGFVAVEITTLPALGSLTDNGIAVMAGQFVPATDINAGLLTFTPAPAPPPRRIRHLIPGPGQRQHDQRRRTIDPTPKTMTVDVAPAGSD